MSDKSSGMTLDALVRAFDPSIPIEDAWTPPAAWYVDPGVWEMERSAVFARSWQPVARISDLPNVGDFASGCVAGEPWVVVQTAEGLNAFSNVCRHKGREVVRGSGNADRLVCGYHAWTYDLQGALRTAPKMAGIRGFDREAMSLPRLAVATWGPWIFINGDPHATDPNEQLAPLGERLAHSDWEKLTYVASRSWTLECNWKVYIDNYLDGGYHVPHMHPTLSAQLDMSTYGTELFEAFSIQSSQPKSDVERTAGGALYAWMFPNFMLNRYGDCMDSNWVVPLGPSRCRVDYDFFFLNPSDEETIASSIEQSDQTQREDVEICESVQRGLMSRNYDRGRYAPRVERGEHHFHRLLAEAYRSEPR